MSFSDARRRLLELAAERGAQVEVFGSRGTATTVRAFNGGVDEFKLSEKVGLGLRALANGAWGYSYTENLSEPALRRALENALENASLVAPEAHARLAAWPEPPHVGDLFGEGLSGVTVDRKVALALELERVAKGADPRVQSVPYATYQDGESEVAVTNSAGLDRSYRANYAFQYVAPLVTEDGQNKMKIDWEFSREFESLDPTRTALKAVELSVALLGGKPAPSGTFPAVIDHKCVATLLSTFDGMFSAKMVQEGKSPLAGRVGQAVGNPLVTIVDDATRPAGLSSRPFDAEGYPSRRTTLVDGGVLQGFLHNAETASKDGVESTGHASRASYKGTIGVEPTNFYLEPGSSAREALIAGIADGLLLTDVMGTHAGANPVTGDFSLQAEGFWITDGKVAHPLEIFTVAGNFLELLADIEAVADDLKFELGGAGAASVRVAKLSVGGK